MLVEAERLMVEFAANLRAWAHAGFSVYAASRVDALDLDGLERLARYVTRPALATGAVSIRDDGRVVKVRSGTRLSQVSDARPERGGAGAR